MRISNINDDRLKIFPAFRPSKIAPSCVIEPGMSKDRIPRRHKKILLRYWNRVAVSDADAISAPRRRHEPRSRVWMERHYTPPYSSYMTHSTYTILPFTLVTRVRSREVRASSKSSLKLYERIIKGKIDCRDVNLWRSEENWIWDCTTKKM